MTVTARDPRQRLRTSTEETAKSWISRIEHDRRALHTTDLGLLAEVAPRLVDTIEREAVHERLGSLTREEIASRSGLAYVAGHRALLRDDPDEALRWLALAHALVAPGEDLLRARIVFELGSQYVARRSSASVDVLLLQAEALGSSPDLVHLRALAADAMGDNMEACARYREVIGSKDAALSPATGVLAMINLAAAWNHRDPLEAISLTDLALAMISAYRLHGRLRAPALNIKGYSLICRGEFDEARETLDAAANEAQQFDHRRVALYARFNKAILDEFELGLDASDAALERLGLEAAGAHPDLLGWIQIRRSWLSLCAGEMQTSKEMLSSASSVTAGLRYAESVALMQALHMNYAGRLSDAIHRLRAVRGSANSRGDRLTEFAILLWICHLEDASGRPQAALRSLEIASEIRNNHTFRVSPNWWASVMLDSVARLLAADGAFRVIRPVAPGATRSRPKIELWLDGTGRANDRPIDLSWHSGRTGKNVLRRLFRILLTSYPNAVPRDRLVDVMWPDSEGDAAVRNLYSATNDLRRVLSDVPGVRLRVGPSGYSLDFEPNVVVRRDGGP